MPKTFTYRQRFDFLAALDGQQHRKFALHQPDLHEPRWTVYDTAEKRTIGYGKNAADAVDHAIERTKFYVQNIKLPKV